MSRWCIATALVVPIAPLAVAETQDARRYKLRFDGQHYGASRGDGEGPEIRPEILLATTCSGRGLCRGTGILDAPDKPAVHPDEAEYVELVVGSGVLLSGGMLID